jgi:hypothetical protein
MYLHRIISVDFVRILVDVALNSANTRRYVCEEIMAGPCKGISNNITTSECENLLMALPSSEGVEHKIDGNTQGCRAFHAAYAVTNPTLYCPHISFQPVPDPRGEIKCQSGNSVLPSDLFTNSDLQRFDKYNAEKGLDPLIGHNCTSC